MSIFDMYLEESSWDGYTYEGEYIDLDENNQPITEDVDDIGMAIFGGIVTAATAAISVFIVGEAIKSVKLRKTMKEALKNYESNNDDLTLLEDFDKKLYKVSIGIGNKDPKITDKEDKENEVFKKLLGESLYNKMRRNKANRFVEYTQDGKFQIGVMYTVSSQYYGEFIVTHSSCAISFAKNSKANVIKHKDYYINKIMYEHGMYTKDYHKFMDPNVPSDSYK